MELRHMPNTICLGGSFNPIHHGHLLCARAAAESLGAQRVVLIPAGQSPFKTHAELAPAADRVQMCRLAIKDNATFEVQDRETRRAGPSYTIQTVRELKGAGWDSVTWLIGADMVQNLPKWHEAFQLIKEAELMVMSRPGSEIHWDSLPAEFRHLRNNVVEIPRIDISSTDIRRRVKAGLSIDFLTPLEVCGYIRERKLYL
jgi:nicotinate-nucleotide adenylyltransferase